MAEKSIDSEVLAALHLMSKDTVKGINYQIFLHQRIMDGALDLIDAGYAHKMPIDKDNSNYCLTPKGQEYLKKLVKYANQEF